MTLSLNCDPLSVGIIFLSFLSHPIPRYNVWHRVNKKERKGIKEKGRKAEKEEGKEKEREKEKMEEEGGSHS